MKKGRNSLFFILFFLCPVTLTFSDGGFISTDVSLSTDQRAIIIQNGDEISMTLSTGYTGDGEEFAWIIPLPVPPEVYDVFEAGDTGEEAFETLDRQTSPSVSQGHSSGFFLATEGASGEEAQPVELYGSVVLDHYEASILGAAAAAPLLDWLNGNGYPVAPEALEVLDTYIHRDWAFVAIKLTPGEKRRYENEFLPPLTIQYRYDEILFPLRISSVSTDREVKITLYVIAESTARSSNFRTEGLHYNRKLPPGSRSYQAYIESCIRETAGDSDQALAILWSGAVPQYMIGSLNGLTDNPVRDKELYLTRFEARITPTILTEDVRFTLDESPVRFGVSIRIRDSSEEIIGRVVSGVLILIFFIIIPAGIIVGSFFLIRRVIRHFIRKRRRS